MTINRIVGAIYRDATNVGLGTTLPTYPLHVYTPDGTPGGVLLQGAASLAVQSATMSANAWGLGLAPGTTTLGVAYGALSNQIQASNIKLAVSASGNVGVGTTTPAYALDVVGAINFTGSIYQNGVTYGGGGGGGGSSTSWTDGTGKVYTSSNVGIGTTAPRSALDVAGTLRATAFQGVGSALSNISPSNYRVFPWTASSPAPSLVTTGGSLTYATQSGIQRIADNKVEYSVSLTATVASQPTAGTDYYLTLPYPVSTTLYTSSSNIIGELWAEVITPTSDLFFKASARATPASTSYAAIRLLSGTSELPLSTVQAGGTIKLMGTLEYATAVTVLGTALSNVDTSIVSSLSVSSILVSSNVGIGTATPILPLHVQGRSYFSGNVGIGTTAPRAPLDVFGVALLSYNPNILYFPSLFIGQPYKRSYVIAGQTFFGNIANGSGTSYHTAVIDSTGIMWTWGYNNNGQIGNNSIINSLSPTNISSFGSLSGLTVVAAAAGQSHTYALDSIGNVHAWGDNSSGQLGNGFIGFDSYSPLNISKFGSLSGRTVIAISSGAVHGMALDNTGTLHGWGYNTDGEIGNNSTTNAITPVNISTYGSLSGRTVVAVACAGYNTIALDNTGTVHTWGINQYGQLGRGDVTVGDQLTPINIMNGSVTGTSLSGRIVVGTASGNAHTMALDTTGAVHGWGYNTYGQIGNGTSGNNQPTPINISTYGSLSGRTIVSMACGENHTIMLDSTGEVHAWGRNQYGQLGIGTTAGPQTTPINISTYGSLSGCTIVAIACGQHHTMALDSTSTVHAWGRNTYGQIGIGITANTQTTPIQVPQAFIVPYANVGIGTTLPRKPLDIIGSVIVSANLGIGTTQPTAPLHVQGLSYFGTNVGIGTTAPRAPLDVAGTILATSVGIGTTLPRATLDVVGSILTSANLGIGTTLPILPLHVQGASYFNGNVGIGTALPAEGLHVGGYQEAYVEGRLRARQYQASYLHPTLNKMFCMPGGSANYLDVSTAGNTAAKGFIGGFTEGRFAYLVPYAYATNAFHGIFTRIDLQNFVTAGVSYLNVDSGNTFARGYFGGFTDGRYAYLIPYQNTSSVYHGILTRVDLQNFVTGAVSYVNVAAGNTNAKGFVGGFTDGQYVYMVPYQNASVPNGLLTRVSITNFVTAGVSYLDLGAINTSLRGYQSGFTDGRYGYLVPYNNGIQSGIFTRVDLQNFATGGVTYLDVSTAGNTSAKGFCGGFTDGRYAYLVPHNNGAYHGVFTRVDLQNFVTAGVTYLDLTKAGNTNATGFRASFTDGRYAYLTPWNTGALFTRVDMTNFTTAGVSYLDISTAGNTNAIGFWGAFTDGRYSYLTPYTNTANVFHGILTRVNIGNIYPQGI